MDFVSDVLVGRHHHRAGPAPFDRARAYGIEHVNGAYGMSAWRWLFILESLPPCLSAFAVYFLLPDIGGVVRLSTKDRDLVVARSKSSHRSMNWHEARSKLLDWRLYGHYAIYFGVSTPFSSLSLFTPTITAGLTRTQCRSSTSASGRHGPDPRRVGLQCRRGVARVSDGPLYQRRAAILSWRPAASRCASSTAGGTRNCWRRIQEPTSGSSGSEDRPATRGRARVRLVGRRSLARIGSSNDRGLAVGCAGDRVACGIAGLALREVALWRATKRC